MDLSNFEISIATTVLFILRYMFIAGLFFLAFYVWKEEEFIVKKLQSKFPSKYQIRREIIYSLLTFIIYGSGVLLFLFWIQNDMTKQYKEVNSFGLLYFVFSIILMIIIHDAYFYWTHRFMHHSKVFKYVHRLHHSFDNPTPWAAFAFHPFEALISLGVIPIIIFFIPYHHWALIIFVTILTLNNIIIHLGFSLPKAGVFEFQNTAVEHDMHHSGIKGNYGLYFNFWDKFFGTYQRK